VAERTCVEARFNIPPHKFELNEVIIGNAYGYMGMKVCYQVKVVTKLVDMNQFYING
jgi:hypothetical protein